MKKYDNIDSKYAKVSCELIMEIKLIFPYDISLGKVLAIINAWNMRLVFSKHLTPKAKIAIQYEKFLKLFGNVDLVIGKTYTLKGTEDCIEKLKLLEIIGSEKGKK